MRPLGHGNSVSDDSELGYFGENGVESLVDDMKQLNDIARREYPGLLCTFSDTAWVRSSHAHILQNIPTP